MKEGPLSFPPLLPCDQAATPLLLLPPKASLPLLLLLHQGLGARVELRKANADPRRVLQELLAALGHAPLFVAVEVLPSKRVHAVLETLLDKAVVHSQAILRLQVLDHAQHLLLVLLGEALEL
uniref:Uncharacterized protein n=1 Tax=Chloropicon laureae TaxID=464258 RepID=A0A7S2Z1P0_9CHLO